MALSNSDCLRHGGDFCKLNHEKQSNHSITVTSTDSGNPAKSVNVSFTITLTDQNDQPRRLHLSGNIVKENATKGTLIGKFSAYDEDSARGQSLSYSLSDTDQGRFNVTPDGYLITVLALDHEANKTHTVTVVVQDNGRPMKKVCHISLEHIGLFSISWACTNT